MKIYIVVASDYEGSCIDKPFTDKLEAEKYAEMKNKYKSPWHNHTTFGVIEEELLKKCDFKLNEDDLCVKIKGYIHLSEDTEEDIEYTLMVKEDWCHTRYTALDDFIAADIYFKLTKEQYDNFEPSKYAYVFNDLKARIMEMHKQGMSVEMITDTLTAEVPDTEVDTVE